MSSPELFDVETFTAGLGERFPAEQGWMELDQREADGKLITLLVNPVVKVAVADVIRKSDGTEIVIEQPSDKALDLFNHPGSYAPSMEAQRMWPSSPIADDSDLEAA